MNDTDTRLCATAYCKNRVPWHEIYCQSCFDLRMECRDDDAYDGCDDGDGGDDE